VSANDCWECAQVLAVNCTLKTVVLCVRCSRLPIIVGLDWYPIERMVVVVPTLTVRATTIVELARYLQTPMHRCSAVFAGLHPRGCLGGVRGA